MSILTRRQQSRRQQSRKRQTRKRQTRKRQMKRRGGAIHRGATVVIKPDDYSPFLMTTPEEAEKLFETRNVFKL
jgi:hypothetical protein